MTKLLNLNDLSKANTREVQIGETVYKVKEMSVEDFIEATRVAEAMEKETSYARQLEGTVKLIKRSIPSIDPATLMSLSLDQLGALAAFIRGEDVEKIVAEKDANATTEELGNG